MKNNRRDFLKMAGMAGAASVLPFNKLIADAGNGLADTHACVLIPSETAGPFPLDLTANTAFFRKDIREGKAGVQLNTKLKIIGLSNCAPMPNVRVNIWHCDKDGLYSGYDQSNNPGQAGLTYLRGYQITDANGEVEFITIFPGWYNGRICHIHFQVYVSSSYAAVSQLTYDLAAKNALYAANASVYTKGADPLTYSGDNVFSDGYQYQIATLTPNLTTGGYDSYLEVTVQGSGTLGVGHLEKENAKHFMLGQNFPNPYSGATTIPFSLTQSSDVRMDIWDVTGRKIACIMDWQLPAGEHSVLFDAHALRLPVSNYVYQIEVKNSAGTFREHKLMTAG